jgi:hypothetical protein
MLERYKLSDDQLQKFAINLIKFTAPTLTVFFGQLAMGVHWKLALPVALYALYATLSDYFKKLGE